MKLATRINSYFRDGDKNLDRVFAEFQSVGLTHVDLNYPEHCTGVTAEDMAAKLAAHDLQLNGCALRFRNAFLNGDLGNADDALAAEALSSATSVRLLPHCRWQHGDHLARPRRL